MATVFTYFNTSTIASVFLLGITSVVYSQAHLKNAEIKHYNIDESGLALEGYDPVSYFVENEAVEGKKEYAIKVHGVTYYFASIANRDMFSNNPERYEPQYGGWCAYAMGESGEKVEIDPETFKILDGKLYLFYNKYFNNTLKTWNKDEPKLKAQADKSWKSIFQ